MTEPESHTFAYLRRIDEKLDGSEAGWTGWRLGSIRSRTSCWCSNGIVLRLEGREIETTGLKAMLDRHERWLGELGRHVAELENSPKDQASYWQVVRF